MSGLNGTTPQRAQVPPRGHENSGGDPTAPPRRAAFPPSHSLAEGTDPEKSVMENHWRRHPSDYHADVAVEEMARAYGEADSARRSERLQIAEINASLSMRDAVLELAAVMRDIRDGRKKVNPS